MGLHTSISSLTEGNSFSCPHQLFAQALALFEVGSLSTVRKSARKCKEIAAQNPSWEPSKVLHLWALALHSEALLSRKKEALWEAKEKIEMAITSSDSPDLLWDAGVIYQDLAETSLEACDLARAVTLFEKGSQGSMSEQKWNRMGKAYADLGEKLCDIRHLFKAVHCFKKGIPSIEGWTLLSRSLQRLFQMTHENELFEESYACLGKALALNPESLDLKLERIELLIETARIKKDVTKIQQALHFCEEIQKENIQLLGLWIEALALLGGWSGRIENIHDAQQKISYALDQTEEEDPFILIQCGKGLYSFAEYFFDMDLYLQTIECFQAALSIDRTLAEGWTWMGKTYSTISDMTQEIDPLEKAIRFYQKSLLLKSDHASYFALASLLIQQGDEPQAQKALEYLDYLLENYPLIYHDNPNWFFQYGLAADLLGFSRDDRAFYQKALNAFSHVLVLDPSYALVHHQIALVYLHLGQDREEIHDFYRSLHYFERASKQTKDAEDLYIDWGVTWIHLADHATNAELEKKCLREAEQKLQTAAKLGSLEAYYPLACLYSLKENFDLSQFFLHKAHKAGALPSPEEIQEDAWLEKLQVFPPFQEFLALLHKK